MRATFLLGALAVFTAFAPASTLLARAAAAAPMPSRTAAQPQPQRVSIQSAANQQFVAVQFDDTLAPWSGAVGIAEQFDLYDLGRGLIALKSVANGEYVTARPGQPLAAIRNSVGAGEVFRRVGGPATLLRLRAVEAKGFVCADGGGLAAMAAPRHCPHEWQLLRLESTVRADLTITAPAPGSTLTTRAVTFQWAGWGDEFWLNIGSTIGGSDVYASGPLGQATEHVVDTLPLNGMTLHVQLRRRLGTAIDVVNVQYIAAIRKGLLVITEFADRELEDWPGAGMKSIADVSAQLREMEAHWRWLSRSLERIQWDIIRVRLAQSAVAGAFPGGWVQFRETVAGLVRQEVATADYDVNGDGTIDAAWLIVCSGEAEFDFLIGGSSVNGWVNMFVDGQASRSVISRATGNFNHELGHLLGLVDMYGPYDTLHGLTLMSFSWPVPPHDFAAYERLKLGWLHPRVITATTRDVWLPPTDDAMAAVMIPTTRPQEYFLIEYRRRPDSGYGSQNPLFNGLAVYHVLEGSSMAQNPPIVKLEPADGYIRPGGPLDPADFVYPDNPALLRPLVVRSYFGDAPEIFRIENVFSRDDGLTFDVIVAATPNPANLLTNGSFESGQSGTPDRWKIGAWVSGGAFIWPSPIASAGEHSAMLEAPSPNDMWWSQQVGALVPGQPYMLCGSLKGEGIAGGGGGGNVSVLGGWVASVRPDRHVRLGQELRDVRGRGAATRRRLPTGLLRRHRGRQALV